MASGEGERRAGVDQRRRRAVAAAGWLGLVGPAIAWAFQLILGDAFAETGCEAGGFSALSPLLVGITAAALGLALLCGVVAWRVMARYQPENASATRDRVDFLRVAAVCSTAIFSVLIVMGGWVPHLFLSPCGG